MKAEYKNAIETKRKICAAYLSLLKNGSKFSVTDIVKAAGINRGTFYLHYNSINDVAHAIEEELASNFKILELGFRQIEIDKQPEFIVNKFNEILSNNLEFYKLLFNTKETHVLVEKIKVSILKAISNNFMVMRYVMNYENFKVIVKYIVGGVLDAYIDWLKGNITYSLEELGEVVCKMIKGGLKGYLTYAN